LSHYIAETQYYLQWNNIHYYQYK